MVAIGSDLERLGCFGMPFEIRTIQHPNNFGPVKIQTGSVFEPPLYTGKNGDLSQIIAVNAI